MKPLALVCIFSLALSASASNFAPKVSQRPRVRAFKTRIPPEQLAFSLQFPFDEDLERLAEEQQKAKLYRIEEAHPIEEKDWEEIAGSFDASGNDEEDSSADEKDGTEDWGLHTISDEESLDDKNDANQSANLLGEFEEIEFENAESDMFFKMSLDGDDVSECGKVGRRCRDYEGALKEEVYTLSPPEEEEEAEKPVETVQLPPETDSARRFHLKILAPIPPEKRKHEVGQYSLGISHSYHSGTSQMSGKNDFEEEEIECVSPPPQDNQFQAVHVSPILRLLGPSPKGEQMFQSSPVQGTPRISSLTAMLKDSPTISSTCSSPAPKNTRFSPIPQLNRHSSQSTDYYTAGYDSSKQSNPPLDWEEIIAKLNK